LKKRKRKKDEGTHQKDNRRSTIGEAKIRVRNAEVAKKGGYICDGNEACSVAPDGIDVGTPKRTITPRIPGEMLEMRWKMALP